MREEIERLATEALNQVSALNTELDASAPDDIGHERELEQAFREAAATLIEAKQELKQKLRLRCAEIIADIAKLQLAMPDVTGPSMSELEPPFRPLLQQLETQTQQFRLIANARTERKDAAITQISEVCSELGLTLPAFDDSLTESDVSELEAKAGVYTARLAERKTLVAQTVFEIEEMCTFLAEDIPSLSNELNDDALAALRHIYSTVESRYKDRKNELSLVEMQVCQIAELLDVPSQLGTSGNSVDRLKAADFRLAELNELKRKCISQVVTKARVKIAESWNDLCVDRRHRSAVSASFSQEASETVLEALENERLTLEALRQDPERHNIVDLLHEYSELRVQEQNLAEASRDPKRLAQRGFSQILKREEATRKLIERKKPPLVQKLLPLLQQWAKEHNGESFMLGEEDVSDIVDQERAKMERRSRLSLPRKRPLSSNATQAADSLATKRVKPSLSTPMLRQSNTRSQAAPSGPLAPANSGAQGWTLHAAAAAARAPSAARPQRHQASQAPVRPAGPGRPVGPVRSAGPATARMVGRPTRTGIDKAATSNRDAAMRTAAIRAASQAVRNQNTRESRDQEVSRPGSRPGSRRPVTSQQRIDAAQIPNSVRTARTQLALPKPESPWRSAPLQSRPQSRPQYRPQSRPQSQQPRPGSSQVVAHKHPIVQSTPVGAQPQRQPLSAQSASTMNQAQDTSPKDWRLQRKLDLQENGLSYYDDSTAELSVQAPGASAPPGEGSFNFNHFF